MLSLLGTDTDANVAAKLGIHPGSVTWRRERLHIPAFGPPRNGRRSKIHWTPRALSLLGTAPDGEIATRLHLTWSVVIRKRQQLGIPSFVRPTVRIQWKSPWLRLLGRRPDQELARQLGVRVSSVKRKREELGIAPYRYSGPVARTQRLKELLKRPTAELQQKHGLAPQLVRRLRREYGMHHFTIGSGEAPLARHPGVVAL